MSVIRVTTTTSVVRVTQAGRPSVRITNNRSVVRVANVGVQGPPGTRVVELCISIDGVIPDAVRLRRYLPSGSITIVPSGITATTSTAFATDQVFPVRAANGTLLGSITFPAGQTNGTGSFSVLDYTRGDVLDFMSPVGPPQALNYIISITIPALR